MRCAVLPGDGVGPEVTAEAVAVARAAAAAHGVALELEQLDLGADRYLRDGVALPQGTVEELRRGYSAILAGAFGDPRIPDGRHAREILLGLRFELDLYVNLRPVRLRSAAHCPLAGNHPIDFVCVRENTEGLYVDVGGQFKRGTPDEIAINETINTRKGVERIIRAAFDLARRRRRRLCMSDKSNALRHAHDLWQRVFEELRAEYPDVAAEHLYIDVLAMRLIQAPEAFDVLVTCNLFGDIISDLGAGLVGGLGLAPSGNIRPGELSLFEPVHGSAPGIAGKGIANPLGAILSAAMMFDHVGEPRVARSIERAVDRCIATGATTRDLGGSLSTAEVGARVLRALRDATEAADGG